MRHFKVSAFVWAASVFMLGIASSPVQAQEQDAAVVKYSVSTSVYPTGTGTATGGGTKAASASYSLEATAGAGYMFLYWSLNGTNVSSTAHYVFKASGNETLVANFGFKVTTSSDPAAGGTTLGGGGYTNGAVVSVLATPQDCYEFVAWTRGNVPRTVSTDPNYTFPLATNETLTAVFEQIKYVNTTVSSPTFGGKVTGGGTVFCGTKVTLTAKPAAGFKFVGWSIGGSPVGANTNSTLKFTTQGNQTYTAHFSDDQPPALAITSTAVVGSLLTVTGTAVDNTGVEGVFYALNGNPAGSSGLTAATTNGFTNWTATAILPPGGNVFSVEAVDSSVNQNVSGILTRTFPSVTASVAPVSLAGLVAEVVPTQASLGLKADTKTNFQVAFGPATFAQLSADSNQGSDAGNYTYAQTGTNSAQLVLSSILGNGTNSRVVELTFSDATTATYSSDHGTNTGSVTLSAGLSTPLVSPEGRDSFSVDTNGVTNYTKFEDGTFSSSNTLGTNITGSFTFTQVGPGAGLLVETFTNLSTTNVFTSYSLDQFTSVGATNSGNYFTITMSSDGGGSSSSSGSFTSTNRPSKAVYLAPDSLAGLSAAVTSQATGGTSAASTIAFTVTFGEATQALSSGSTSTTSAVSDYTYTRTGASNATVIFKYFAPPQSASFAVTNFLFFSSRDLVTYVNAEETTVGVITLSSAATLAPAALAGKTIVFAKSSTDSTTATLGNDGTYTSINTSHIAGSGSYTFAQITPEVVLLVFSDSSGSVNTVQMTFANNSTGSFFDTQTSGSSVEKVVVGHFTVK